MHARSVLLERQYEERIRERGEMLCPVRAGLALLLFLVALIGPLSVFGQDGEDPLPTGTESASSPPVRKGPPAGKVSSTRTSSPVSATGGMISLNFDDADVFSVVQTVFGDILRVNYVVDPRIKGRVTFRSVAPIAKDQVLPVMEVILRINAIGVVEDNGLYRIVPLSDVSREPSPISFGRDPEQIPVTGKSMIQVVPVTYLQSTEVVKLIAPFLSANAVVLDVPKSNQIIVVDTDASIRRVLQLIDTFDNEKQKKKRATVYVYPVQNGKAKDIASLLNQIYLGARPGMTGTSVMGVVDEHHEHGQFKSIRGQACLR